MMDSNVSNVSDAVYNQILNVHILKNIIFSQCIKKIVKACNHKVTTGRQNKSFSQEFYIGLCSGEDSSLLNLPEETYTSSLFQARLTSPKQRRHSFTSFTCKDITRTYYEHIMMRLKNYSGNSIFVLSYLHPC